MAAAGFMAIAAPMAIVAPAARLAAIGADVRVLPAGTLAAAGGTAGAIRKTSARSPFARRARFNFSKIQFPLNDSNSQKLRLAALADRAKLRGHAGY
jgi:hypothetical protein